MIVETFSSQDAVQNRIATFERKTKSNFVLITKDKSYGVEDWRNTEQAYKKSLYWKIPHIPYDNIPFLTLGRKILGCHLGKSKKKQKLAQQQNVKRKVTTKKVGCPAQILIHHVIKFPEYPVEENCSVYKQKMQKKKLREALLTDPEIKAETVYYVELPVMTDHTGHPTDGIAAGKREKPDPLIKQEIANLTHEGVGKVSEMKRHISAFVKNNFEEEEVRDTTRRRFHPLDRDIRNIMQRAKSLMRHSMENQENMSYAEEWQHEQDHFPYHPPDQKDDMDFPQPDKLTEVVDASFAVLAEYSSDEEEKVGAVLPRGKVRRHDLQQKCAIVLKQITESMYQLKDTKYLEDLYNELNCKLVEVQLRTPFEVVIHVGSPQPKRAGGEDAVNVVVKKEKIT